MSQITRRTLMKVAGAAATASVLGARVAHAEDKVKIGYAISKTGPNAGGASITIQNSTFKPNTSATLEGTPSGAARRRSA